MLPELKYHTTPHPYSRLAKDIGWRKVKVIKAFSEFEQWSNHAESLEELRNTLSKFSPIEICRKCKNEELCEGEIQYPVCGKRYWSQIKFELKMNPPCFKGFASDTCTKEKKDEYGCDIRMFWLSCSTASFTHLPRLPSLKHRMEENRALRKTR